MVDQLIDNAFEDVILDVAQEQLDLLEENIWDWPRDTKRENGEIVGSPRDIIDRGELKESFELIEDSPHEWRYFYGAAHADKVHNGAYLSNGTELPARPWIDEAVENISPYDRFGEILREEL